jgi:cytochrome P450
VGLKSNRHQVDGMKPALTGTTLLHRDILDDPYPFYRQLQVEAPVWRVPATDIFVVTRFALLEEVARRVDDFSSNLLGVVYKRRNGMPARLTRDGGLVQALATADPPSHAVHKKAVFPELVAKRMSAMTPEIAQVADHCISRLLRNGSGDFVADVANPLPITVVSRLVGFTGKGSDIDKLLRVAFDSTAVVGCTLSLAQLSLCLLRSFFTQRWIAGQLRTASMEGDNILASVKRNMVNGTLSEAEGRAIIHTLLAAGGESTSSLLGNAVRILAEDQSLQQTLRAQPELIPNFIEEVLRLESPFRCHLRSVPSDTSLGGIAIPAGATLLLFWGAGNRDPDTFARPDEIDLARPRIHMSFGKGIHTCLGAPLARLEGKIVLQTLLLRTSQFALAPGRRPVWVESLQVRRHASLPVVCSS